MSRSLYGWILHYLQSDGKCEGCDLTSCARFPEALFCPYTGAEMRAMKQMWWTFTDAEPMEREAAVRERDRKQAEVDGLKRAVEERDALILAIWEAGAFGPGACYADTRELNERTAALGLEVRW